MAGLAPDRQSIQRDNRPITFVHGRSFLTS
jgi:hypothetical protein